MSAVAIPMKCPLGESGVDTPNAKKHCVITNWWREQNEKGVHQFPSLDFERQQERNVGAGSGSTGL